MLRSSLLSEDVVLPRLLRQGTPERTLSRMRTSWPDPTEAPQLPETEQCRDGPSSALFPPKHWVRWLRSSDRWGRTRVQIPPVVPSPLHGGSMSWCAGSAVAGGNKSATIESIVT